MLPALASHVYKLRYLLKENSTTILTAAAVSGTVVTAVTTARATFQAAEVINDAVLEKDPQAKDPAALKARARIMNKYPDPEKAPAETQKELARIAEITLSPRDKAKLVWRLYAIPAAAGVGTITCIILAHRISAKRIAALTVASGISERALREYKEKVAEKFGDRKDQEIREAVAQDRVSGDPSSSEIVVNEEGKVLCYDTMTGRYFRSSIEDIKRAENFVNFQINQHMGVSFSNFCEEIGLEPTTYTDMVGWNINNLVEVQFSTTMSRDQRPCIAMSFARAPSPNYDNSWT